MKTCYTILLSAILLLSWTNSNDCRNFNFGSSSEIVMKKETAIFMKRELLSHNLIGITFIEHGSDANYLHTYTFHSDRLNGLKTKKLSLIGDNSMMNALYDYRQALIKYSTNCCGAKIKEKTDKEFGLRSFSLEMKNKKIFVNLIQERGEYFLVESILKK
jgi:hypothetical protein